VVRQAIEALGYQPDPTARALQSKKSSMIGLVVPVVDYAFFSRLTDAVEQACSRFGYKLLLCQSAHDAAKELEMVALLKANKVDGILLCSRLGDASLYTQNEFPIISIDREIPGVPSVNADNYSGGMLAAGALFRAGCRRPLILTTEVPEYMAMYQRQRGFLGTCDRLGMQADVCVLHDAGFGEAETAQIKRVLTGERPVDGVFALGDMIAAGYLHMVLQDATLSHLRLPLVGFDGLDISRLFAFSTVAQPIREMGERAVELLIRRINGEAVPEKLTLPVTYIERRSTQPRQPEQRGCNE
jgi:DNA-binding LacI/PurR family transcriptional regulator